ncbi:A/G-specific adenine glycosylase [Undibacterium sp. Jales W-56]|uniref:A/G-specific adenine glycosylase n=1 Tax=Undibacterium sp. Jales W-56 TaxID=2897325 RepID=UPI0021CF8ECD|nr:A/G-specific adenine glycosylase [Undibacterium sp. Jales W-56]MCU6432259.1 A/G-specific adenine glycosylase [Undibacterium sp. Jales W-56]
MKSSSTKVRSADRTDSSQVESVYADPSFSADLIQWQKQYGRHELPWQNTTDAYRVWLSEIMLQQTQVAAVIPYYQRFLASFPTVFALADAPSEEVMAHWSGLGYYTRARNLHQCAKQVVVNYAGKFPADPQLLQQLPGIGRSTAAAIAAFSYGSRAAILDGNVKRVLARVFGIAGYPGTKKIEDDMWLRAQALLPETGIESYTQGLMDMGATLCTRSSPSCPRCPMQQRCVAHAEQRTAELPTRKPKKQQKEKQTLMLVLRHQNQVLLEQRPDSGIWGGLLSLPELDGMQERNPDESADEAHDLPEQSLAAKRYAAQFGEVTAMRQLPGFSHGFTHFKLHATVLQLNVSQRSSQVGEQRWIWLDLAQVAQAALPAPVKKYLLAM